MERAEQFALHKRPRSTPNEGDEVKHLPLGNKLPIWGELPLDAKLPFNEVPRGSIKLFTTKLSQPKFISKQQLDFDLRDPEGRFRPGEYKCLHDPHLKQFFNKPSMQRHLVKEGYMSRDGHVLCTLPEFHQYRMYLRHMLAMQIAQDRQIERRLYEVSRDVNANNLFAGRIPHRRCPGKASRRRRKVGQRTKLTGPTLTGKLRRLASLLDNVYSEMTPRDKPATDTGHDTAATGQDSEAWRARPGTACCGQDCDAWKVGPDSEQNNNMNHGDGSGNTAGNACTRPLGTDPMATDNLIRAPLCCHIPKVGWLLPDDGYAMKMAQNRNILQEEVQLIQPPLCCHFPKTGWPQSERERYINMANNKTRKILQAEIQRIDNWTAKQGRQNALLGRARALQQKDYETRFHNVRVRDRQVDRDRKRMQRRIDSAKRKNDARHKRRTDLFNRSYAERMAKRKGSCTCGCQCMANLCAALRSIHIPDRKPEMQDLQCQEDDTCFEDDTFSNYPQLSRGATATAAKPRAKSARPTRPGRNPKVERAPSMFVGESERAKLIEASHISHLRSEMDYLSPYSSKTYTDRLRQSGACTSFFDEAPAHRKKTDIATSTRRATISGGETVPQRKFSTTSDVALIRAGSMTFAETLLLRLLDDINNDKLTKQEIAALASCAMEILPLPDQDHKDINATAEELEKSEAQDSSATVLARNMVNFILSKILDDVKTGAIDDNELVQLTKIFLGSSVKMKASKAEDDTVDADASDPNKFHIFDPSMDDYIFDTLRKVAKDLDSRTLTTEQVAHIAKEVEKEMELKIWSTQGDSLRRDNSVADLVEGYRNRVKSTETDLQIMRRIATAIVESYDSVGAHWPDIADTATDLIKSLLSTVEKKVTGGAIKDVSVDKVKTTNTILKQDGLNDKQISQILFSIISAVTGLHPASNTLLHSYADKIVSDVISKAKEMIDLEVEASPGHLADKIIHDALIGAEEILHCRPHTDSAEETADFREKEGENKSTLSLLKEVTVEANEDEINFEATDLMDILNGIDGTTESKTVREDGGRYLDTECNQEEECIQKRYDNSILSFILEILTNLQVRFSNGEISDHSIAHFFQTISPHDIHMQTVEQYAAVTLYEIIEDVKRHESNSLYFRGIIDKYLTTSDSSDLIEEGDATKALESILVNLSADILSKFVKATLENVLIDMKVVTDSPLESRDGIPPVTLLRKASSTISINVVQEVLSRIESPTVKSDVGLKAAQSVSSSLIEHAASSTFQQDLRHQAHIKHSRRHTITAFTETDQAKPSGKRRMSEPPTGNRIGDVVLETLHNTIANLKLESAMRSTKEPTASIDNTEAIQQQVHDIILEIMEAIVIDMQDKQLQLNVDDLKEENECVDDVTDCVKDVLKEVLGEMNEELANGCSTDGTVKAKESDMQINGMIIDHLQRALSGHDAIASKDIIRQPQMESVRSIVLESLRATMVNVENKKMSQENVRKFHLYLYDFVMKSNIDPSLLKALDEKYTHHPEQNQTTNDMVVELLGLIIEHIKSEGLNVQSLDGIGIGMHLATLGAEPGSESSLVFSDTALSCESGLICDLVDEILTKMCHQINTSNELNHNSKVASSHSPSVDSIRDRKRDDHVTKSNKTPNGNSPNIESVAESLTVLAKQKDSNCEDNSFTYKSHERQLSPSEHSDRSGSLHSGSVGSFTSSGSLLTLSDASGSFVSGSDTYSNSKFSELHFWTRSPEEEIFPEEEINTNANRPKSATPSSQTITSKRYNRNTNSGKTIVTFVKETSGISAQTNEKLYSGSARTSVPKRKKPEALSLSVKQNNKTSHMRNASLDKALSAEHNLQNSIHKQEKNSITRIIKSSTSTTMYGHIDRIRRVYANTPATIPPPAPVDNSRKTDRKVCKKNGHTNKVQSRNMSPPASGDQIKYKSPVNTGSKITPDETTPDKISSGLTPDMVTCKTTSGKAKSNLAPGKARGKTMPDTARSKDTPVKTNRRITHDKTKSKAQRKLSPNKARSKVTPDKARRRITADKTRSKTQCVLSTDETRLKLTPDKAKRRITPDKTRSKTQCEISLDEARSKVTPDKTKHRIKPDSARLKATSETTMCKTTQDKSRRKVTHEKTMRKARGKTMSDARQCESSSK